MVKKWDLKRGTSVYLQVPSAHIKQWIRNGKIKTGETVVRYANFSGWCKPEELEELIPFFKLFQQARREKSIERKLSSVKKQVKNILIVDDEKELCSLLGYSLSAHGFKMAFAHSKHEALKSLKKSLPDLVLLDIMLPDGDGMSLLAGIRKMAHAPEVIITTAYGSDEARSKAKKEGACDFIVKPYNEDDIIFRIKKMSAKRK